MYMVFLNLITIKLCILYMYINIIYPLVVHVYVIRRV